MVRQALHRDRIIELLRSHAAELARMGVTEVSLFGSIARNEATEASDVDVLIDTRGTLSLFELGGVQAYLEDLLGMRVDLVTRSGIDPRIRDVVFREAVRAA